MVKSNRVFRLLWRALACLAFLGRDAGAGEMERVRLAGDRLGFVLAESDARFVPWGHNYATVDLLARLAADPERVERDFAEMKAAGTTVARVHPEMPRVLRGPGDADPAALGQLRTLLGIAERSGIRLMITGLACYRIDDRLAWYDALDDEGRWNVHAFFWDAVARTCAGSPAVFAYDLANEPASKGPPDSGWYMGRMGEVEFCQRLSLDPARTDGGAVFREWTTRMVAAIRAHDADRLVTLGMLPFPGAYEAAFEHLDFVSPHLYPKKGKVAEEIDLLGKFACGKPIVIGETFPLECSAAEEREFLVASRSIAHGWLGYWPDTPPERLAEAARTGAATIHDAIWLSWVRLFEEVGPTMTGAAEP